MKRYDERDIMFARMNYKPGTPHYEDYYSRNPEKKRLMMNFGPELSFSTVKPQHSMISCRRLLM